MKKYYFLLVLSLLMSIPFLGRGLFESSEGRYAMVAKTMVESGNYWMPQMDGHVHLTKPPLTYWIISLGQKIFGLNTFGSRIIHAFLWCLLVLVMMRIGELLTDRRRGYIIALVFLTSLFPALGSWFLTTDAVLVFFQGITFWTLLEYRQERKSIWIYGFWMGIALAFNTKGPVALFPLLFWFPFMTKDLLKPIPVILGLACISFWYLGLEYKQPGILGQLIQDELIKRSTTDYSGRNAVWWAPLTSYFLPSLLGWGIWPFFMKKKRLVNNQLYYWWIGVTLVVFSLIQSRLILYILPLAIPFSIVIGKAIDETKLNRALTLNLFLILMIKTTVCLLPYDYNARQIADFAVSNKNTEKVYFVNEYLYGVEFYLGNKFARIADYNGLYRALKNRKVDMRWIVFREKRQKDVNNIIKHYSKKIVPYSKSGNWVLAELK